MNVLITGASSGIGQELARVFAGKGHRVIAVARREDKLIELKNELGNRIIPISNDISKIENIDRLYEDIKKMDIEIDLIINNAGIGEFGYFLEGDTSAELHMIDLNIKSLTYITKIFTRDMIKRGGGGIINVASTAAFQSGGPLMSVYYASKSYVLSFTEALIEELEYRGVRVMTLCPGPTSTDFRGMRPERIGLDKFYVTTPRQVAECCYKDYFKDKHISVPGISNKILAQIMRFLPRKVQRKLVKRFQKKKKRFIKTS